MTHPSKLKQKTSIPLTPIVNALRDSRRKNDARDALNHPDGVHQLPSRAALAQVVSNLFAVLFPLHYGRADLNDDTIDYFVGDTLDRALTSLEEQVRYSMRFNPALAKLSRDQRIARAIDVVARFAKQLPDIRKLLLSDIRAALLGDPAATCISEVLLCYPGVHAIIHYRLAHALYLLDERLLARLICELAHSSTGVDIHPGASIGEGFFIDHGTGVVIGETTVIGKRVRLYQAVTLGAKSFPSDDKTGALKKGLARHPIVEDDVVIYAGATLLGRITIGARSVIGGNVWLTHSVPKNSTITQGDTSSEG